MSERIFIGVAWPYASGARHLGHIAGAYLPADIFARYHRIVGNQVLMVSGSDEYGTPITVAADKEGVSPEIIAKRYHRVIADGFSRLGISFDLYTETSTENHTRVVQDLFLTLLKNGYIVKNKMLQPYCETDNRYLPDRYVEGTCPFCGYAEARGDQCDNCGRPLDPTDMPDLRCILCGNPPVIHESEHFFLDLPQFSERLLAWLEDKTYWRSTVLNFTQNYIRDGLRQRAITRDISWGVPVPVEGFDDKRIYVWFDAVTGYLSASIEWAQRIGEPDRWKDWWTLGPNGEAPSRAYYFIGKDNIPFHTIIWPSMLMGYGGLNLPYDVPANEYLTLEEQKLSTSRSYAIWLPDYLERYEPDPLRYYLSSNMPETRDTNFSWSEFVRRNNDELVATYGNLAHRVLTFTFRNFEQKVPEPGQLDESQRRILKQADGTFVSVGDLIAHARFKDAIREVMSLAQTANRYLDEKAPWKQIKVDRAAAGTSLFVVLQVINALKVLSYPFLPFSAQTLHGFLGFDGEISQSEWKMGEVPAGQALREPAPLFKKLEEATVEEELARLGLKPQE
jgi:methionyl-tRNA synthetase